MGSRCAFWLAKKNRFCANPPISNSLFCGNHTNRSESQWISCPIDPSHSVLQENLDSHLRRCPLLKQTQTLSHQPFYQKGINAGKENEEEDGNLKCLDGPDETSPGTLDNVTSEMKRNAVFAMTVAEFFKLVSKIKYVHASVCGDISDSFKIPEACGIWINREVERKLPFQEKHVLQQASILGNLEETGVLNSSVKCVTGLRTEPNGLPRDGNDVSAVVEFGAGRGYLTQMLADCYGVKKVFLVERKAYKLKADRSLRQKESLTLERLRIDIEDLNLNAVESLEGVPYLAIGKHLCGPATDLALRCCISEQHERGSAKGSANTFLRGIAIATCCHHLCQWKNYTNRLYLSSLGIGKSEFHAITWFTSWAVDADHGSEIASVDGSLHLQFTEIEEYKGNQGTCGVEEIISSLSPVERAVLGFMCKDIIDFGRFMWLKKHGLSSRIVKYVPSSISPENHLLIGRN